MLFLIGCQISKLGSVLDFEKQTIKIQRSSHSSSVSTKQIRIGGGHEDVQMLQRLIQGNLIRIDLYERTGLEKAKGLTFQYNQDHDGLYFLMRPGARREPQNLLNPKSGLELDQRQEAIESLDQSKKPDWSTTGTSSNSNLVRFYNLYWSPTMAPTTSKMENSWEKCIARQDYFLGIKGSQKALASMFTFACTEFSDTPEVQLILSKAMVKRDPTNPIAWWYLCRLDNTSLYARIDLDWRKQKERIQKRMGTWKIGKAHLEKRFSECL